MAVGAFVDAVVRWRLHDRPVAFRLNLSDRKSLQLVCCIGVLGARVLCVSPTTAVASRVLAGCPRRRAVAWRINRARTGGESRIHRAVAKLTHAVWASHDHLGHARGVDCIAGSRKFRCRTIRIDAMLSVNRCCWHFCPLHQCIVHIILVDTGLVTTTY